LKPCSTAHREAAARPRLLLWAATDPDRLSIEARALIEANGNELWFSVASLWEIVFKNGLGRADFQVDPHRLRRALLDNGYRELMVTGEHTLALVALPALHKDPFDRMLVAQATVEGILLLTGDTAVARYPGPIRAL
jgi:PIN domain nuclease of toxin-antitoxin system